MSYKTYEKYKDSGIEWIGEIPEHWEIRKMKNLIFFQEGPGLRNWQFTDEGVRVICVTNITEKGIDFSNYEKFISKEEYKQIYQHFTVNKGDLLLSSSGNSWGKVAEYVDEDIVILNTSTIRINENENFGSILNQSFIKYGLQSEAVREQLGLMMTGSCQPNFGPTHLARILFAFPNSKEEQKVISSFLDKRISIIEKNIDKNKELISLLEEKKNALINQAVTKGLNPNVPMKDSGIDIVGDIPSLNSVIRLKFLCDIITGDKDTVNRNPEGSYPFYVRSPIVERIDTYSFDGEAILMAGDGVGAGKVFHYVNGKFDFHQRVYNLHNFRSVYPKFFYYYLSNLFTVEVDKGSAKSTVDSIRLPMLKDFRICLPSFEEQIEIVNYLDKEIFKIEKFIGKIQENIHLLEEYKTSLIYNIVTGKVDVRDEI